MHCTTLIKIYFSLIWRDMLGITCTTMLCKVLFIYVWKEKRCGCGWTVGIMKGIPILERTLVLYMLWGIAESLWIDRTVQSSVMLGLFMISGILSKTVWLFDSVYFLICWKVCWKWLTAVDHGDIKKNMFKFVRYWAMYRLSNISSGGHRGSSNKAFLSPTSLI